jgi:hypothetical protein
MARRCELPRFTPANARAFGSKGGSKTFEKYGAEHMRQIGRRGFAATAGRHFMGDVAKCLDQLVEWGAIEKKGHKREDNP